MRRLSVILLLSWTATAHAQISDPQPDIIWRVPLGHAAGMMAGMRLSLSVLWPSAYNPFPLSNSLNQYGRAWTEGPEYRRDRNLFESDGDPWTLNVLGHGLFGAEMYSRFRTCGGGPVGAFLFAAGSSAVWEFGPEAFNKRPSAVDLLLTPVIGAALGEGRVRLQRWLQGRPKGIWRRTVEIIIDPLGEGERVWLGTRC